MEKEKELRRMKKSKKPGMENYLERIPLPSPGISWSADAEGGVTLFLENKGGFHWLAQKLLRKPRQSQIHLDEMGSFLWPLMDGERNLLALGLLVEQQFGEKAQPLYERLAKYFQILDSYRLISWSPGCGSLSAAATPKDHGG